ncbi:MAG: DUF4177 domain-containing protein [Litoreibacter sp.]|nr:DUF4177 domain-containing protein [Litoreibacter sp.]
MPAYEYRVIAAPRKGKSAKGLRSGAERFAHAIDITLNEMAEEGWEYQRAETLPAEERKGLTGKKVVEHALLVFRREVDESDYQDEDVATPVEASTQVFAHQDPPLSRAAKNDPQKPE